eukprot:602080-Pelagomonas_calceolata.AAC.2
MPGTGRFQRLPTHIQHPILQFLVGLVTRAERGGCVDLNEPGLERSIYEDVIPTFIYSFMYRFHKDFNEPGLEDVTPSKVQHAHGTYAHINNAYVGQTFQ